MIDRLERHRERILDVLAHVHDDPAADLRLERLAERAGLSPFRFHRAFRAIVGDPPARYVRRRRLDRAAAALHRSQRTVADIALEAGYDTHEAFTRAFKAEFGLAPSVFRDVRAPAVPAGMVGEIVDLPPRSIAYLEWRGPYARTRGLFEELLGWAKSRGLPCETTLGVYFDDQRTTAPVRTRCHVGIFVGNGVEPEGEVRVRRLPGGACAVVRAGDGYQLERVRRAYDAVLVAWLPGWGRAPSGAPFEVYPLDAPRTEICVPLATA